MKTTKPDDFDQELNRIMSATSPAGSNPFGDRGLRERILRRIDEGDTEAVRRGLPFARWAGFFAAAAACLLGGTLVWQAGWLGSEPDSSLKSAASAPTAGEDGIIPFAAATTDASGDPSPSALLLGLKQESYSNVSYRTLLLVSDGRGEIGVKAQRDGIVAPYGMDFWELKETAPVPAAGANGEVTVIDATPITGSAAAKTKKPAVFALSSEVKRYEEELLFVGNRFASLQIEIETAENGIESRTEQVRVSDFARLQNTGEQQKLPVAKPDSRYMTPLQVTDFVKQSVTAASELVPGWATGETGRTYDWGVIRNPGRWTARLAEPVAAANNIPGISYRWVGDNWEMPEAIVSHDRLCCNWNSITAMYPKAFDAVSSPAGDWVALLMPDRLVAHAVRGGVPERQPLFEMPLAEGERTVMAQWATGSYVEKWSKELGQSK